MDYQKIKTLADLKKAKYKQKSIKDELRENLIYNIQNQINIFEGIHGYEKSVIPEIERAILSRHNINLLGLRGQAKTRIARLMVNLLDEFIPYVEGSEIYDDPIAPISRASIELTKKMGDDTPISWLHRSERFAEKLATPDVTVADLIGDIDPIKAANLKLSYADDRVIHYGMIPRANRCIFVINELPDLQARIQVSLFNILQEGDVQIRGFKLRLELDMQFIFTANPEDYTNRGSIVTPLKDRIGSQILTHYPKDIETAKKITNQEIKATLSQKENIYLPSLAADLLEEISFEARQSEYIDEKSGVSARLSISALENLLSSAEQRLLRSKESKTTVRLSDFSSIIPSITGKVELVYEGEQEGAEFVANKLIDSAIKTLFEKHFPKIEKLEKQDVNTPYDDLVTWFFNESKFEILNGVSEKEYEKKLLSIEPLNKLLNEYHPNALKEDIYFLNEFVLWGLVQFKKLSKVEYSEGIEIQDPYGNYIKNI
ncbi:sigma 54-interacting transcriptional regulator [Flavobacteriales bacterium]|nr:sigma 54-interacting transcriptional regulator [Flavobacteriales bacterium]|tara:strand:+ start:1373 stop:2836 length:1464 start_codon:yes stop_codon:yes gene_type:complete